MNIELERRLAELSPRQRQTYDTMIAGLQADHDRREVLRLALDARIADKRTSWEKFKGALWDFAGEYKELAMVALFCIGAAGTFGVCTGIALALIRAGWRAGATL